MVNYEEGYMFQIKWTSDLLNFCLHDGLIHSTYPVNFMNDVRTCDTCAESQYVD